ncbi:MAG: transporter [Legionellaceae bacterium]|nr:transporter [Legionellaceae bacterium]HAF87819.1 transporter [Legionellales bacterium]HCA89123.1 transporter [Legionellales bacterium]|tara:strand:- start:857 stop:1159 length:303 start_codon:yes stop_codon:yes gene_type:complete
MKKYLSIVAGLGLSALVGCQVMSGDESLGQYGSDTAITTNVKAALLKDKRVNSLPINVKTEKGMVVLSGFVRTPAQKIAAGQAARRVHDVKVVRNNLIVR